MAKIALGMTVGFLCGMKCACMNRHMNIRQMKKRLMRRLKG